jgi:hypothetical protein
MQGGKGILRICVDVLLFPLHIITPGPVLKVQVIVQTILVVVLQPVHCH